MKKLLFFLMAILFAIQGLQAQTVNTGGMNTPPVNPATLPYSCNFEDPIENAEWQLSNATNTNKWYIGSPTNTQLPISGACLYVSSDNGTTATYDVTTAGTVVATRTIEFNGANQYLLNFDLFIGGESSYDYLKVFLVDVDSNFVGVSGSTYPNYALNTYATNQLLTNYAGTAPYFNGYNGLIIVSGSYPREIVIPNQGPAGTMKKLVFVWKNDGSTGTMPPATIDNISLIVPTCPSPSTPVVSNILANSVDLSWTENGIATQWLIEYKLASETNWANANSTVANNTASSSLTGLLPNTNYNVRIKAVCGSVDESIWLYTSFLTACDPFVTIPFSDFFDNYASGSFPQCWTKVSSNTNPVISTSYKSSGPNSMYMYTASGAYNYLAMSAVDLSVSISSISAYFRLYKTTAAYNITVGVMSDPTNSATFDSIVNLTPAAISSWQFFSVNFANYTGTGRYIAFKVQGFGAANGMYIDDFTVMETPSCNIPTGLTRNSATYNSMELDWNSTDDANCTGWIVEYKPYDDQVWLSAYTTSHPFTISNLVSNVVYRISVKAVCVSGDTTLATDIANYGLPCEPITYFPWEEGFEDVWFTGNGYGGTADSRPWCWFNVNGGASASYKWQRTTIASYVRSGLSSLQMYAAGTTGQLGDWMITPAFTFTGNERIRFWAKGYSTSYNEVLNIRAFDVTTNGIFDAVTDTTLFVNLTTISNIPSTTWAEYEIDLSQFVGDYQIAFVRNTTGGYYLNIDDMTIDEIPACQRPNTISTSNILSDQVQINFTSGNSGDNLWWVYYKPTTASVWDSVQISSNPGILGNLTQNTNYQYYLRTDCGSELSDATNIFTFKTACNAVSTIPYTENFDTYGTTSGTFPSCWFRPVLNTTTPWPSIVTANVVSSPASLKFQSASATQPTYAITPQLDVDINTLRVLFKLKAESTTYSGTMHIGVMSDPSDTSTFELVQIITPTSTNYTNYEIGFANTTLTGTGKYIAFKHVTSSSYYYYWLDDVVVDYIPVCPDISQLSLLSSTASSVTINWTFNTNAGQGFEISYANVNTGFDPNSGTIISVPDGTTLPYVISNLTPGQFYSFAVRQACNGNWSNIVVTNTDGLPAVLPYSCDFSDINEQASWKISNGNATNKFYIGTPSNVMAPISGANLYISSDLGVTNSYNVTSISTAIASRLIEFDGSGGYSLNFDLYIGGETSFDYIKVFLTDPDTTFLGDNTKPYYAINTYNGNNQLLTNYNNAPYFNAYNGSTTTASSFPREIVLPYQGPAGTVKRLIILWANDGSDGTPPPASIDNIVIEALTCPIPTNVATNNLTSTSTDIVWVDPSGTATEWIVKWKPVASTTWDFAISNATTHSLSNLTINTAYNVSIATVCGSDTSIYANFYFVTPCADITIPYTQNFDAVSGFPTCWTRKQGATNPATSTSYLVSSPNSLYFYASGTYQYAATPPVDINVAMNTLQVTFKQYRTTSTYTGIKVGVMTDPNNMATFEQIGNTVTTSALSTWEDKIVLLNSYTGTGRYIALVCDGQIVANGSYLDNFEISVIPSCPKPQFLTATTTDQTALLSWTETGSATEWEIEWGLSNFVQGQGTLQMATDTFLPLSNLTQNTTYKYFVRSICGVGDTSLWSGPFTFSTQVLNTIPNLEPFLTTTTPVGYNTTGWTIGSTRGVTGNPGNNIYKNIYSTTTVGQFNTANYGPIQSNTVLTFDYKVSLYSSPYGPVAPNSGSFIVAVSTDWGSTYVNVDTVVNNGIAGYQSYSYDLSAYNNEIVKIRIIGTWVVSDYDLGIDNIYVGPTITCFNPVTLSVNNITSNSVNLNWIDTVNTGTWNIQYGPTGFTLGNGTIIPNVPAAPYNLTNLTPQTTYQFYVQADCGGGDLSLWTGPYAFTTACLPITSVPYIEYFDTYTTGTSAYPTCWSKLTSNATYPYIATTNFSTPGSLYLYSSATGGYCHAITPMFDATIPINTLKAEFKLRVSATDDTLYVGVMTDPTDLSTFVLVQKLIPTATTTWQDMEVFFDTYNGTGQYIAFKNVYTTTTTTIYVDNLEIFTIPTCPRPTQLVSSNSTSTSTTLSWTEAGSATSWNIEYGPIGFTPGSGTTIPASSNPFILNGLTHSSCYDFYVQAVCSPTDLSIWSNKGTFCTAQITANVPFNIDFETPSGVQIANNTSGNNWYIGSDTANTVNNTTGGQNALYVSNDNGQTNAFTITSAAVVWAYRDVYFTPSTTDYTFSFNWKGNGEGTTTAYDYLSVYIGTPTMPVVSTTSTITVPTGSDTIVTKLRLQPTWQTATFTMPTASYSGQIKRIYFMWRNDGSGGTQPPASVDNISITSTGISTCLPPTNITSSSITATSAQISWTAGGTETAWELDYKLASASTWTTIPVATNATHLLNTLLPVSTYEVRVRAVCGASEFSGYTLIHTFTTTNTPCDVPTNLQVTNITDQSALATWNAGTAISWQVEYKLVSSANWTSASTTTPSFQISGLQSSSNYEIRVKAICSSNESAFTTNVPFTTTGGTVTYTITATAGANGTITPSGVVTVNQGASQTFNFTPSTGYIVSVVTVDGSPITGAPTSYTFTNVSANRTIHVDFISGISENELEQLVELFPNPTTSTIELRLKSEDLHVKECKIYDMYGKLMKTIQINAETITIDVTDFASGVYFVRMDSEIGTISKKFVKK